MKTRLVNIAPYEAQGYFLVKEEHSPAGQFISRSLALRTLETVEPSSTVQQPQEAPAYWVKGEDGKLRCSACNELRLRKSQPFCHHCGRKMLSEDGEIV